MAYSKLNINRHNNNVTMPMWEEEAFEANIYLHLQILFISYFESNHYDKSTPKLENMVAVAFEDSSIVVEECNLICR